MPRARALSQGLVFPHPSARAPLPALPRPASTPILRGLCPPPLPGEKRRMPVSLPLGVTGATVLELSHGPEVLICKNGSNWSVHPVLQSFGDPWLDYCSSALLKALPLPLLFVSSALPALSAARFQEGNSRNILGTAGRLAENVGPCISLKGGNDVQLKGAPLAARCPEIS